jgi:hypothetical protein
MAVKRYELNDGQWAKISSLLPGKVGDPERTGSDIAVSIAVNASWGGYIWSNPRRDIQQVKERFDSEADACKDRMKSHQITLDNMRQKIAQIAPQSFQTTRAIETTAENRKGIEAATPA